MNEAEIALFAENITRGIFASVQNDTRLPEQVLLDDLQDSHDRSQLYDVWRVRELVETLGFKIYCSSSEFPLSIRSRLNLPADAPAVASVELGAILVQSWPLTKLASDLRLHPRAVLAASILHEVGHLLSAGEQSSSQVQTEKRAWKIGRELLQKHALYGFCSDGAFSILEANARNSYGDPAIVHQQTIGGSTYPSLL